MRITRKLSALLFTLVLFISLMCFAFVTSANLTLTNESKVKTVINSSGLYTQTINHISLEAEKTLGVTSQASVDSSISNLITKAYPKSEFKQDVSTVIGANYNWLKGSSSKPNFTINLAVAKLNFISLAIQYLNNKLDSLPNCSVTQSLNFSASSIFTTDCKPLGLSQTVINSQITQEINTSSSFLVNPFINASSVKLKRSGLNQTYYVSLNKAPKGYQWLTRAPYVFFSLVLISSLGVMFLSIRKLRGIRRVGLCLAVSGCLLLISSLCKSALNNQIQKHNFSSSSIADVHSSVVAIAQSLISSVLDTVLLIAIIYLVLSLLIAVLLFIRKGQRSSKLSTKQSINEDNKSTLDLGLRLKKASTVPRRSTDISPHRTKKKPPKGLIQ